MRTALGSVCSTLWLIGVAVLSACQSARLAGVDEQLDRGTGFTLLSVSEPFAFSHTEGRYSLSARDYIFLGPVEVNRQGVRDYYLWVGVGTTLDRGYLAPEAPLPDVLYLSVRGELMALELRPWEERVPELAEASLYRPAVKVRAELAARVSRYQLDMIAREPLASIRVVVPDGRILDYARWGETPAWSEFFARSP